MTAPDETPAAEAAPARQEGITISREELGVLPVRRYEGPIHLIHQDGEVAPACQALRQETLLGFDIETRPSFRVGESHPPALIQLASRTAAYVFQLHRIRQVQPLLDVLADPAITKAGVAIPDDLKKLRGHYAFEPAGFVDIAPIARDLGYKQTGLRALSGLLFGFRLSKREQRSNWAAHVLSRGQLVYAATDAWVSRELYFKLAGADR